MQHRCPPLEKTQGWGTAPSVGMAHMENHERRRPALGYRCFQVAIKTIGSGRVAQALVSLASPRIGCPVLRVVCEGRQWIRLAACDLVRAAQPAASKSPPCLAITARLGRAF